ncbi:Spore cortex-lytic enzyme precursor [compost metagenome]
MQSMNTTSYQGMLQRLGQLAGGTLAYPAAPAPVVAYPTAAYPVVAPDQLILSPSAQAVYAPVYAPTYPVVPPQAVLPAAVPNPYVVQTPVVVPAANNPLGLAWVEAPVVAQPQTAAPSNPLGISWQGMATPAVPQTAVPSNPLGVDWQGMATPAVPPAVSQPVAKPEPKPEPKPDPKPAPTPAHTPKPAVQGSGPLLEKGASGEPVKKLQARLKELGFDPKGVDGDFGPSTEAAVRAFQAAKGLGIDGVVGPTTWGALGIKVEGTVAVGALHERRESWFISQFSSRYNTNEDTPGNGNCGPTSLTMVAKAFGKINPTAGQADAAIEESRRRMGDSRNEHDGTSVEGIARGARSYGLDAKVSWNANSSTIANEIAKGRAVIVHGVYIRQDGSYGGGHYYVVTAIKDGKAYLNDPAYSGGPRVVSVDTLMTSLKKRGTYGMISIAP